MGCFYTIGMYTIDMKQILVYSDSGVNATSFNQTIKSLQNEVDAKRYAILPCNAHQLVNSDWESETALLIIPGGRDIPYHQKLFPLGIQRIHDYVAKGGSYLGICAGAYFGAREIEFEKGGDLEVCGARDLVFFPGKAVGPALGKGKFRYDSDAGVEAANVMWRTGDGEVECHAFFYGGCYFENASIFSTIEVLGTYADLPEKPAAAIFCPVKKGRAVLSGVHLEYSVHNWKPPSANARQVRDLLRKSEEKRRRCLREILLKLNISIDNSSNIY